MIFVRWVWANCRNDPEPCLHRPGRSPPLIGAQLSVLFSDWSEGERGPQSSCLPSLCQEPRNYEAMRCVEGKLRGNSGSGRIKV